MTDEEKVARLAAILGIEGAVQYGRYHGPGERSDRRGYREARLGSYAGDGATDADALRWLAVSMERSTQYIPASIRSNATGLRTQAKSWRQNEETARTKAERLEADARALDVEAANIEARFCGYIADRGTEGAS